MLQKAEQAIHSMLVEKEQPAQVRLLIFHPQVVQNQAKAVVCAVVLLTLAAAELLGRSNNAYLS